MHPLVRGAAAAAIFTALGSLDRGAPRDAALATLAPQAPRAEVRGVDGLPALCGAGTLPEGPVCIRIPTASLAPEPALSARPAPARSSIGEDIIPRRPERPADLGAYTWPIGGGRAPRLLEGGEDAALRLAARPGEQVLLVALDKQQGPAEVIFAGDHEGTTLIITAHVTNEGNDGSEGSEGNEGNKGHKGSRPRTYILVHRGLDHLHPDVTVGAKLTPSAVLGAAPLTAGGALIAITLEAREVRDGAKIDADPRDPKRLTSAAVSVPTDARNVLALK